MSTTIIPYSPLRKLPIGIQSFEKLRSEGFLYVDKTALAYRLIKAGNPCFLSRPRRFGKSLLLSTFEAYFEGKKELFKGLAIEQLEQDWFKYPVLHLVLIDEYDKPLLRSFHDEALQADFRETLTAFYSVLKSADPWLQFVFITGVTKFAQMGIFSNLNQLNDISFDSAYNTLCGMTRSEIEATFAPELLQMTEKNKTDHPGVMEKMTQMYDGYRFTHDEEFTPMYNPFSVLSALSKLSFGSYWFASGTPTFLVEMLKKTDYDLRELDGIEVSAASLSDDRADIHNPIPMVYQSGYLTIKKFDERFRIYTLGFPNEEVEYGFLNFAAPFYTPVSERDTAFYIGKFVHELETGDVEAFLNRMEAFFADFPYELNTKTERHYQVVFYLVFKLMGQFTDVEVRSSRGRADAVVRTLQYIYVFEFKLNGTAEEALQQIDDKGYLIPYQADGRKLIKIGVEFSAEKRNLNRWLTE